MQRSAAAALAAAAALTATPAPAAARPADPRPVRIQIPALKIDAPVIAVGLGPGGALGTPAHTDAKSVAWYNRSAPPGTPGPTVMDGHIDTKRGPAVFIHLDRLSRGSRITLVRRDRKRVAYAVDARRIVNKDRFPGTEVMADHHRPELWLITCAAPYGRHAYVNNLIVHAHAVR
ncbi:sortase domain-bontaining protein [Mangrovactinospora gilvigrisea]|nr:class F sortase [Mangrovactinospora gilvigrisea]